jgi:hypothetical protein
MQVVSEYGWANSNFCSSTVKLLPKKGLNDLLWDKVCGIYHGEWINLIERKEKSVGEI